MSIACVSPVRTKLVAVMLLFAAAGAQAPAQGLRAGVLETRLATVDAQIAWKLPLPVRFTSRTQAYRLLDGVLYAIGDDGRVRSVDAATGLYLWTAAVAPGGQKIWGPVPYRSDNPEAPHNAAVFTTFSQAVLIDAVSGRSLRRVTLPAPPTASVVVFDKWIFTPTVGNRVSCSHVDHGALSWQIGTRGMVQLAPIYIVEEDLLVIADDAGVVHGSDSKRHRHFTEELGGRPCGWIASDDTAIYVTTAGDLPAIHALNRKTGKPLREPYRLSGRPMGGPVLTRNAVYQSLADGGVHCVSLTPEAANWFSSTARMFLAEWPGRVALLRTDGMVEFVDSVTRRSAGVLDLGVRVRHAVSNPHNDAAFVASERGEVWSLRPASAGPLDPATFRTPTSRPATQPSETLPTDAESAELTTLEPAAFTPIEPVETAEPAATFTPDEQPGAAEAPPPAGPNEPRHSLRGRLEDQLNRALDNRQGE